MTAFRSLKLQVTAVENARRYDRRVIKVDAQC